MTPRRLAAMCASVALASVTVSCSDHTGSAPRAARILPTESGHVLFLTIAVGEQTSLTDAHQLASDLEEDLRARVPGFAEVVVHTEP